MRLLLLITIVIVFPTSAFTQPATEWSRAYTFEESVIDLHEPVVVGGKKIGRATFRWTFDQPETVAGDPSLKFKSKLEQIDFDCDQKRFRPLAISFVDANGKTVRTEKIDPLGPWRPIEGVMMENLSNSVCLRVAIDFRPVQSAEDAELVQVTKFVFSLYQRLGQTKDFSRIVREFFAPDYIRGYLQDSETKWFFNLNSETAAKASHSDLERFYLASINSGYLSSLYFISQQRETVAASYSDASLIPHDLAQLINRHPYARKYRHGSTNYDFLADEIDSIDRMRSYTDLLERSAVIMRRHVMSVNAEHSPQYREILQALPDTDRAKTCRKPCLGLPEGTRLFEAQVPMLRLQLAKINGRLRVVSATAAFP